MKIFSKNIIEPVLKGFGFQALIIATTAAAAITTATAVIERF